MPRQFWKMAKTMAKPTAASAAAMICSTSSAFSAGGFSQKTCLPASTAAAMFAVYMVGCFVATKYAVPYIMFRAQQHDAVYKTIADAAGYLEPDDTVYVVDRNGVARAFPQKFIWQPHIFGGDYGGELSIQAESLLIRNAFRSGTPLRSATIWPGSLKLPSMISVSPWSSTMSAGMSRYSKLMPSVASSQ